MVEIICIAETAFAGLRIQRTVVLVRVVGDDRILRRGAPRHGGPPMLLRFFDCRLDTLSRPRRDDNCTGFASCDEHSLDRFRPSV